MRAAFVALLVVHGAIHIIGFAKAFGLAEVPQLQPIGRPMGAIWMSSGLAFFVSAALFVFTPRHWWVAAVPALVLSQIAIATSWGDARFGTVANLVVLLPAALSLLDLRSTSFLSIYEQDVARGSAARAGPDAPVTEADVARLPPLVQTYVRRTGAVGRPRVHDVRTRWRAQMRMAPGTRWMRARATQHNFFDEPRARFFLMEASRYGVPFAALHRYAGAAATMQVRAASLFDIVNARGPEMDQAETVTMFNDMCVIAPASLVDAGVLWQEVDGHSVRGTFTNAGHTVAAVLSFDAHGDLVNFVSEDRYLSADGKTYQKLPWSTPLRDYGDFDGRRVASRGEAVWKQPGGDYVYGRFELEEAEYNPRPRSAPATRAAQNAAHPVEVLR